MNDKKITYTLLSILSALVLSSCSNENLSELTANDDAAILFSTSLPGVTTRSDGMTNQKLDKGFFVTAFCPDVDKAGTLNPYFDQKTFTKDENTSTWFKSEGCRWPDNSIKDGTLRFFAFFPSIDYMRTRAEGGASDFTLTNGSTTTKSGSSYKATYAYNLTKFKVNKYIKRHIDLVVATVEGTKSKNLYSGMNLFFVHPLSRIDVKAFGKNDTYDIEIAGVSMGGVCLEGNLKFPLTAVTSQTFNPTTSPTATNPGNIGYWTGNTAASTKGRIEYIFEEGDTVVQIGSGLHTTNLTAISIMGNGGPAFVVPGSGSTWNTNSSYNGGRYVSVLMRIKDKSDLLLYPYIDGRVTNEKGVEGTMSVIYLSVDTESGEVKKRVYKKDNEYYTSPEYTEIYTPEGGTEIRDYGWAAIANNFTTSQSTNITLTINYSNGIGVEDPADPNPGKPIISGLTPTVTSVEEAPDINIKDFKDGAIWDVTGDLKIE